jgi:hypothetical protein
MFNSIDDLVDLTFTIYVGYAFGYICGYWISDHWLGEYFILYT